MSVCRFWLLFGQNTLNLYQDLRKMTIETIWIKKSKNILDFCLLRTQTYLWKSGHHPPLHCQSSQTSKNALHAQVQCISPDMVQSIFLAICVDNFINPWEWSLKNSLTSHFLGKFPFVNKQDGIYSKSVPEFSYVVVLSFVVIRLNCFESISGLEENDNWDDLNQKIKKKLWITDYYELRHDLDRPTQHKQLFIWSRMTAGHSTILWME